MCRMLRRISSYSGPSPTSKISGDLHPREDRGAAAQEELAGLAVEDHVTEWTGREPPLRAQVAHRAMKALAAHGGVGVIETRKL